MSEAFERVILQFGLGCPQVRGCIQKFPDWVDNEIYAYNNKHTLRGNTKGYGDKCHYTDSQNSDTTAPSGRELYHLKFSLQAASPETSGYTLVRLTCLWFTVKGIVTWDGSWRPWDASFWEPQTYWGTWNEEQYHLHIRLFEDAACTSAGSVGMAKLSWWKP
jgi:hypothetical protein